MSVTLQTKAVKSISPKDMKDGQIAVIVYNNSNTSQHGKIVQRFNDKLIVVGLSSEHSWTDNIGDLNLGLRLLEVGEEIMITSNGG